MSNVHFIAIGGQSMSGIARILLSQGHSVSGSDVKASNLTEELEKMGARIHIGHRAENLVSPDRVVVSSAIHEDNPELMEAKRRGIPVVHRMDMLLEAVSGKKLVAVAGSHGKTTTTSMIAWILVKAGKDPTYLVGGEFGKLGNARPGGGTYAVIETDESDGSFLKCHADVALVTNIDNDHMEFWGSMDALEKAFFDFLDGTRPGGTRVVCLDDELLRKWAERSPDAVTYSVRFPAVWEVRDASMSGWRMKARVFARSREVAMLDLGLIGMHNLANALGAVAAANACGVSPEEACSHMASFPGAKRRMERIGVHNGVLIVDDFSHHPSEVVAALKVLKSAFPEGRVIVVFQPHRYARTRILKDEFGKALSVADAVFVTGIYAGPGENTELGVGSRLVSEAVARTGHPDVRLIEDAAEACREAALSARPGDVVVTMGAGDVWKHHGAIQEVLLRSRQ
ncbi:MAG: UDP-N-acetylmuramate--L-alanine ligase [Firmicutes bacterium]|nr:UDP-N-acetylmuramate--L-alanine ligase [Candidatus Fermentithermobacillaceae bacterium]